MENYKFMMLTKNEAEMLWGGDGPYSEVKTIINTRILDDKVSRVMIEVEGHINPTTFRIIKKNINKFIGDPVIMDLMATAKYEGKSYGYHISAGAEEYDGEPSLKNAKIKQDYMQASVLKMHKFVIKYLRGEVK
jgi:hypothetical protein